MCSGMLANVVTDTSKGMPGRVARGSSGSDRIFHTGSLSLSTRSGQAGDY